MSSTVFPPQELTNFDRRSAGRLVRLRKILQTEPIILIMGAGVPASAGLPNWNELMVQICQVFFCHWQSAIYSGRTTVARPPKQLSIVFPEPEINFIPDGDAVLALGKEFASHNPVLAAQQIKNCIRDLDWIWLLRKCLYGEANSKELHASRLIESLGTLCADVGRVRAVINYNYDSVFEDSLSARSIRFTVLADAQQSIKRESLPIYHVHGYLKRGGGPKTRIILAEDDYHEELVAPYSWANLVQSSFLIASTCVFVGTSMTDPNLRRLLRSAFKVGRRFHYAFLPSAVASQETTMVNALFDQDLYGLGVAAIRYPVGAGGDSHALLPRALDWIH